MAITPEERKEVWESVVACRGVKTPCKDCEGLGTKLYATTGTWRSGIGGSTLTDDVCNKCWGSGDADKHWPSHRLLTR